MSKRIPFDICPICDGVVLAPESLYAHLRDGHAHHPCLYPGCTLPLPDAPPLGADPAWVPGDGDPREDLPEYGDDEYNGRIPGR